MLATEETFFFGDQVINSGLPFYPPKALALAFIGILEPAGPVAIDFVFALRSRFANSALIFAHSTIFRLFFP
jgi:hypothetical protein